MIKILIADDHQMFIDGLKAMLSIEKNITVVGEALNGKQVIQFLKNQPVDIVVLDIEMPQMDGIETTKTILSEFPATKVLILTMYNDRSFIMNILEVGASGYILKHRSKEELVVALNSIYQGRTHYGDDVMQTAVSRSQKVNIAVQFTKREKEILVKIGECKTTNEISEDLFIAPSTVETHVRNLLNKLELSNRMHLVKYAVENGYTK